MSNYIPVFALYNNKPLQDDNFISWLRFPMKLEEVKAKNINIIYEMMNLSSSHILHYISSRKDHGRIYVIHHHSLFVIENYYDMRSFKPILLLTLATCDKDRTEDSDFIVLTKNNLSNYPIFVTKLIKKYEKDYPVIKVNNIESLIYANMHKVPLDVDCISVIKKIFKEEIEMYEQCQ